MHRERLFRCIADMPGDTTSPAMMEIREQVKFITEKWFREKMFPMNHSQYRSQYL